MIYSGHMKPGLVILLSFLAMMGFGCAKKAAIIASPANCQKAEYPFACVLDKAMAAKDPSLCVEAGDEKIANCINGYQEVTGLKINCAELKNPATAAACERMHKTK